MPGGTRMSPQHDHGTVAAHEQTETHKYTKHFPEHAPRAHDKHYGAFEAYRKHHKAGAVCYVGERAGHDQCHGGLELHHAVLEFATINAVDPAAMHKDFPEISEHATADEIAEWAESSPGQFLWLCEFHHRGHGGAHYASHADWSAQLYVPGFLS